MASTRLEKTFTASNRKTFTISTWVKRGAITVNNTIYGAGTSDSTDRDYLVFLQDSGEEDKLYFNAKVSNSTVAQFYSNRRFRDPSAWYHIVLAFDTTQSTDTNRMKLYVNGELQTFQSVTYPNQNRDMNTNNTVHKIGSTVGNGQYFNGLMSYFAFVDGTQYDPSYFGETDSSSGIWKIKTAPSVTYGTNGFFLKMDTSSPGTDTSGNSNTFTASGTPTLTQDNASNNFITLNSLNAYYTNSTFSNGNTTFASGSSYSGTTANILLDTGKWYWEVKVISKDGDTDNYSIGIQGQEATGTNQYVGGQLFGYQYYGTSGQLYNNNSAASYGNTYTAGDIIGVALDCTNNKLYFSKNGTFQNSGNPSTGSNGLSITAPASVTLGGYYPSQTFWSGSSGTFSMNFGNGFFGTTAVASSNADAAGHGLFEYTVPTGFYTLNTKNLNTYG